MLQLFSHSYQILVCYYIATALSAALLELTRCFFSFSCAFWISQTQSQKFFQFISKFLLQFLSDSF